MPKASKTRADEFAVNIVTTFATSKSAIYSWRC